MKKIIHATDFSENALLALEFAIDLSERFKAELILLHVGTNPTVIRTTSTFSSLSELEEIENYAIIKQLKAYASPYLNKKDANFKVRFISKLNSSTGAGIMEAIIESDADLIVVGTKGQNKLKRIIIGSTTKDLVETAPCPVLAIPEDAVLRGIKQIVYASDFNPNDIQAIKSTIPISQLYHAKVTVLHLFENESKEASEAKDFQQQLKEEVKYLHIKYDTEASHNIIESLVNYLKTHQTDLLVMFEKEKKGIIGLFQKGTVKQFVDYAKTIPLMSFNIHSTNPSKKDN